MTLTDLENSLEFSQPRTSLELSELIEESLLNQLIVPQDRVYVPNSESPVTISSKSEEILGPISFIEPEVRNYSLSAKNLDSQLVSIINEISNTKLGIDRLLSSVSARVAAVKSSISSPDSAWVRKSDRFLDYTNIDQSSTSGVLIDAINHSGVSLSPSSEVDLTPQINNITIVPTVSSLGIPGDNVEISSIQALPSQQSPQSGSTKALTEQQSVAVSGGSGLEPIVTFASASDSHNSLSAVFNNNEEEFFDWERIFIPPEQPCKLEGTAYVYDPSSGQRVNIRDITQNYGWTAQLTNESGVVSTNLPLVSFTELPPVAGRSGNSSTLRLSITIDLGSPTSMNQILIAVRQVGGLWPTIASITASSDSSQYFRLRTQSGFTSWSGPSSAINSGIIGTGQSTIASSLWEVPSFAGVDSTAFPVLRYINILLTQEDSYLCPKGIGHPYYVEVSNEVKSSSSWFGLQHSNSNTTTVQRFPNPDTILNIHPGIISQTNNSPGVAVGSTLGQIASLATGNKLIGAGISAVGSILGSLWGHNSDTKSIVQAGEYVDIFQGYRQVISLRRIKPSALEYPINTLGYLVTNDIDFGVKFSAVRLITDQIIPDNSSLIFEVSFDSGITWQSITPISIATPSSFVLRLDSLRNLVRLRVSFSTSNLYNSPRLLGYQLEVLPYIG